MKTGCRHARIRMFSEHTRDMPVDRPIWLVLTCNQVADIVSHDYRHAYGKGNVG